MIEALGYHLEHPESQDMFDIVTEKIGSTKDRFYSSDLQRILFTMAEMGTVPS